MEPSMDPVFNHSSFESQFKNSRDALLHATCTMLEYLGFRTTAWDREVFDLLNNAFEACAEAQLQPRFVLVKLFNAIEEHDPKDSLDDLLPIIADIIGAATEHRTSSTPPSGSRLEIGD